MANVKVFADKQTDRRTNRQAKNYMSPIYRCGGIKSICIQVTSDLNDDIFNGAGIKRSISEQKYFETPLSLLSRFPF